MSSVRGIVSLVESSSKPRTKCLLFPNEINRRMNLSKISGNFNSIEALFKAILELYFIFDYELKSDIVETKDSKDLAKVVLGSEEASASVAMHGSNESGTEDASSASAPIASDADASTPVDSISLAEKLTRSESLTDEFLHFSTFSIIVSNPSANFIKIAILGDNEQNLIDVLDISSIFLDLEFPLVLNRNLSAFIADKDTFSQFLKTISNSIKSLPSSQSTSPFIPDQQSQQAYSSRDSKTTSAPTQSPAQPSASKDTEPLLFPPQVKVQLNPELPHRISQAPSPYARDSTGTVLDPTQESNRRDLEPTGSIFDPTQDARRDLNPYTRNPYEIGRRDLDPAGTERPDIHRQLDPYVDPIGSRPYIGSGLDPVDPFNPYDITNPPVEPRESGDPGNALYGRPNFDLERPIIRDGPNRYGGLGGEGMFVTPDHPMFQGGGGVGGDGRGRLPWGAVPPGARFDPIMPFGEQAGMRGGGRGFGRGGGRGRGGMGRGGHSGFFSGDPDNDEFYPPSNDFM